MRDDERIALASRAIETRTTGTLEAVVLERHLGLTRFTRNAVHQNLDESETLVRIRAVIDGRAGWASTNSRLQAGLHEACERALAQARLAPKPDIPVILPQSAAYDPPGGAFDAETASTAPQTRAAGAAKVFDVASASGAWAAGYVSSFDGGIAIANSNGLRASFSSTAAEINVKCIAPQASGYAEALSRRIGELDASAVARRAAAKATNAGELQTPDLGECVAVVEPAAVGELVAYLLPHFSAERVYQGASFLSDGLDRTYAGENVTLVDDYAHPLHASCPFDGEGTPTSKVTLLEDGIARDFVTDTEWSRRLGRRNTGHYTLGGNGAPYVHSPVLFPGTRSRQDLIASTKRGILITRFWYIRVVDQRKSIVTGMTRDGTFEIRDGKVGRGLRNFRFNVNILDLLRDCEFSSELARTGGYSYTIVAPAAKFNRFTVSSVTSY